MLSSSRFKAPVQRAADPIARILLRARVRPNHLTVAGLGVSCLAAWALADGQLRAGAALLTVAGLFDLFDGSLARLAGQDTDFGAFLDSVVDRYSDLVVLLGLVVYCQRIGDWTLCVFTMAAVVAELNADDWKARDRAAAQRVMLGPSAAGVLKSLRDGQPPEVRQRIDQVLSSFESAAKAPPPPAPAAGAVGDAPANGNSPADVDIQVVPEEKG